MLVGRSTRLLASKAPLLLFGGYSEPLLLCHVFLRGQASTVGASKEEISDVSLLTEARGSSPMRKRLREVKTHARCSSLSTSAPEASMSSSSESMSLITSRFRSLPMILQISSCMDDPLPRPPPPPRRPPRSTEDSESLSSSSLSSLLERRRDFLDEEGTAEDDETRWTSFGRFRVSRGSRSGLRLVEVDVEVDPVVLPFVTLPLALLGSCSLAFPFPLDGSAAPPFLLLRISASISSIVRTSRFFSLRRTKLASSKPALKPTLRRSLAERPEGLLLEPAVREREEEDCDLVDLGLPMVPLEDLLEPLGRGEAAGLGEAESRAPPSPARCARARAMLPDISSSSSSNMALRCRAAFFSRDT